LLPQETDKENFLDASSSGRVLRQSPRAMKTIQTKTASPELAMPFAQKISTV
jgi:hypothetical protein